MNKVIQLFGYNAYSTSTETTINTVEEYVNYFYKSKSKSKSDTSNFLTQKNGDIESSLEKYPLCVRSSMRLYHYGINDNKNEFIIVTPLNNAFHTTGGEIELVNRDLLTNSPVYFLDKKDVLIKLDFKAKISTFVPIGAKVKIPKDLANNFNIGAGDKFQFDIPSFIEQMTLDWTKSNNLIDNLVYRFNNKFNSDGFGDMVEEKIADLFKRVDLDDDSDDEEKHVYLRVLNNPLFVFLSLLIIAQDELVDNKSVYVSTGSFGVFYINTATFKRSKTDEMKSDSKKKNVLFYHYDFDDKCNGCVYKLTPKI